MCRYCDYDSNERRVRCNIFTNNYYLDIETCEYDEYFGGYLHYKTDINYCPWCGRNLKEEVDE